MESVFAKYNNDISTTVILKFIFSSKKRANFEIGTSNGSDNKEFIEKKCMYRNFIIF